MQGVGSRRPLLLRPRGVPPAHGCVPVRLCGCVPLRWLLSRRPGCAASAGGVAWWLGFAVVAGGMSLVSLWRGSCSTCLRLFVVVVWLVFVGGLGGIATIGAALRRVAGVSGVYGRKTPRVVAQRAVHLGGMRVTWGVWGVVDYVLGVVASPCGVAGSARAVLGVFQWVRPLPMSGVAWYRCWCGVGRVRHVFVCLLWWCGLFSLVAWGELLP